MKPTPRPGIDGIKLYTPGDAGLPDRPLIRLASNENIAGPSPKVHAALENISTEIWRYPSALHDRLRASIAHVHNLPAEQIVCGNGSDELLSLLAFGYAGPGDEIITTEHGFEIYAIVARAAGATPITVPETDRRIDIDAIHAAVTENTKLVYIANPANPTSTFLDHDALNALADGLPPHVILVLDGAYAEFAQEGRYDGGAALVAARANVVMTRTFSKLYALGGARIGWAYAPKDIIDTLNRIRGPFNLSAPALAAADAAINDQAWAEDTRQMILENRTYLTGALRQIGLHIDDSEANFILVRFPSPKMADEARSVLLEAGYATRSVSHYGLPEALRITIAAKEHMQGVINSLSHFLGMPT